MARDIEVAVCDAALKVKSGPGVAAEHVDTSPREGSQSIDAGFNSRVDYVVAVQKTKHISAADHFLAAATNTNATFRDLPETHRM